MAKFFRGDKRRREMDRKRRGEEKQRRLQFRREMRAKGLDPDMVDADGNPLPGREGGETGAPIDAADDLGDESGPDEGGSEDAVPAAADAPPVADRSKP
jgi:hypothetical protein